MSSYQKSSSHALAAGKCAALIATLPKSGTWYAHTFFWCYDQLLRNAGNNAGNGFKPDLFRALRDRKIKDKTLHRDTFGIDALFITHTFCPGFQELNDPRLAEWKMLYAPFGYDSARSCINHEREWVLSGR